MKKIFKIAILFSITVISFSCEEEIYENNNDISQTTNENTISKEHQELYNNIISINNLSEQRIILSSFKSKTQSVLWQIKLDNFIENNPNLTNKQLNLIIDLKKIMTPDNFDKAKNKDLDLEKKIEYLKFKITEAFQDNVGWYLLNKFENINQTLKKLDEKKQINSNSRVEEDTNIRACNCGPHDSCARITGLSLSGISWEYGNCGGICYSQTFLFGLWESDNTGRCFY